jgi:3-carboxy-cis,cis-muconate cycloisomerase
MAELAIVTGTVGKIARDLALLSQAEVGEMLESPPTKGVGGSSAMPHKRNPVACLQALAAAVRAPGLMATLLSGAPGEHVRARGGWQAEQHTVSSRSIASMPATPTRACPRRRAAAGDG